MSLWLVQMVTRTGEIENSWVVLLPWKAPEVVDSGSKIYKEVCARVTARPDFHPENFTGTFLAHPIDFDINFTQIIG